MRIQHLSSILYRAFLCSALLFVGNAAFAASSPSTAESPTLEQICGTSDTNTTLAYAQDSFVQRQQKRDGQRQLRNKLNNVYQVGQVAVIENDGSLLRGANPFDLAGREIQFLRRPRGMSAVRAAIGFKDLIGDPITLGDDDALFFEFPDGETYSFGDRTYNGAWVHSDGNVTFGEPEASSLPRDLSRLLDGPPRVAALFSDLDPTAATGNGGVYVAFLPGRFRVTWLDVPNFDSTNSNTVQLTLFYATGRALVVFGDQIDAPQAVVGVRAFSEVDVMDYSEELPRPPMPTAIAESFSSEQGDLNDLAFPRTFFQGFQDRYHSLIFFLDFEHTLRNGAFAYHIGTANDVQGIGLPLFDNTSIWGSDGELRSYVNMGDLSRYPDDPDTFVIGAGSITTMGLLGHEAGHRWMARLRLLENGEPTTRLLGRQEAHWSFHMHSEGSMVEGNFWTENGDGTFTTTDAANSRYGSLDQYMMGLRPPALVNDFFWIQSNERVASDPPAIGATIRGTRNDVTIDDVIAANGPRVPARGASPQNFRMAFVLVTNGGPPSAESVEKVDLYRRRFMAFFNQATNGRGTVVTGLFPR